MSAKKTSNNSKSILITLGLGCLVLGYVFLVFLPGQKAIASLRVDIKEKQQAIVDAHSLHLSMNEIETELNEIRNYENEWRAHAPVVGQLSQVFSQISSHAQKSGTTIRRLEPRPVNRMAAIAEIPIALTLEGDYFQIFEFLRRVDEDPMPIWYQNLQMQATREDAAALTCQMTLQVFADNRENSE